MYTRISGSKYTGYTFGSRSQGGIQNWPHWSWILLGIITYKFIHIANWFQIHFRWPYRLSNHKNDSHLLGPFLLALCVRSQLILYRQLCTCPQIHSIDSSRMQRTRGTREIQDYVRCIHVTHLQARCTSNCISKRSQLIYPKTTCSNVGPPALHI